MTLNQIPTVGVGRSMTRCKDSLYFFFTIEVTVSLLVTNEAYLVHADTALVKSDTHPPLSAKTVGGIVANIKESVIMEAYVTSISAHNLAIERGRYAWPPIPVEERLCVSYPNELVDAEMRFMATCENDQIDREKLYLEISEKSRNLKVLTMLKEYFLS